ncbi:MAG: hypothetical protein VX642_12730 [Bdellovibrionota bacterium]|nr:hypothetical protein [Bdellovibrionota bacterium]
MRYFLLLFLFFQQPIYSLELKVNSSKTKTYQNFDYQVELLKLVLTKAGEKNISIENVLINDQKQIQKALSKNQIDIGFLPLQMREKSSPIKYVPYPIRMGLLGYRVLLVNDSFQTSHKSQLEFMEYIKSLKGGFLDKWEDLKVLRNNGLKIRTFKDFESLMKALKSNKIQYISRSILEINSEFLNFKNKNTNLRIEEHFLIHYPFGEFFYVNSKNNELFEKLERGFDLATKDGSWKKFLLKAHKKEIKALKLSKRETLEFENQSLKRSFTENLSYWLKPEELK